MKRLLILVAALLFLPIATARAQVPVAVARATCGSLSLTAGRYFPLAVDLTGNLCGAGGSGGGGAVTIANGASVALGSIGDTAWVSGNGTAISILKAIYGGVTSSVPAGTNVIGHIICDSGCNGLSGSAVTIADGASVALGSVGDTAWAGSGDGTLLAVMKAIYGGVTSSIPAGTNVIGHVIVDSGVISPVTTGKVVSSTLTMTSATTAYVHDQLIATNATAGSVVNPSFTMNNTTGVFTRLRLSVNDTVATSWGGQTIRVDLWSTTPTWTNGDRAAWSPATGAAVHLGAFLCIMSAVYGDGAYSECVPDIGEKVVAALSSSTVYWSLDAVTGSGVTGASGVWTLKPEFTN